MADGNHLKRSFAQVAELQQKHSLEQAPRCEVHVPMSVQTLEESSNLPPRLANNTKRISRSISRPEIRCQADLRSLPGSFPSFMSALGHPPSQKSRNAERRDSSLGTKTITGISPPAAQGTASRLQAPSVRDTATTTATGEDHPTNVRHAAAPSAVTNGSSSMPLAAAREQQQEHQHTEVPGSTTSVDDRSNPPRYSRECVSVASESTNSSPTTTSSTFDSPLVVDPSPSSSPESPSSVTPLPMKSATHCVNGDTQSRPPPSDALLQPSRPGSPRKGKNLKNLSLKIAPPKQSLPSLSTAPVGEKPHHISAPSSPIYPPSKPARRRQPNLTIQTPSIEKSFSTGISELVPPTPSGHRTLRHFESSPSLNSVSSPTTTQFSNLPFPSPSNLQQRRQTLGDLAENPNSASSGEHGGQVFRRNEPLQALGEEDDGPRSRESLQASERGYPDGPICIYDSGVYLYLEPRQEEAAKFDVIFNVAKEVANPFKKDNMQTSVMSVWETAMSESSPQPEPTPSTAFSEASFKSAKEHLSPADESPSTPRAGKQAEPEYIHVPWDHHSEILDDLYTLCEMIDERILKGKSVLIHCQLGVSRSASLVIAYGLYKNPDKDFNTVYSLVKERSSWVGPNMSLIYQLTDFRSKVRRGCHSKPPPEEWFREEAPSFPAPAPQEQSQPPPPAKLANGNVSQPLAPREKLQANLFSPAIMPFSPAATTQTLPLRRHIPSVRPKTSGGPRRNISPRPLPLREKYQPVHPPRRQPRPEHMAPCRPVLPPTQTDTDTPMHDISETPALFSPKTTEMIGVRYNRNSAGDLAVPRESFDLSSSTAVGKSAVAADPRSPQQRKERIIMRNIDEFL